MNYFLNNPHPQNPLSDEELMALALENKEKAKAKQKKKEMKGCGYGTSAQPAKTHRRYTSQAYGAADFSMDVVCDICDEYRFNHGVWFISGCSFAHHRRSCWHCSDV